MEQAKPKIQAPKFPKVSDIFNLGESGFVVITSCDLEKETGTFAFLQNEREAKDFIHAASLRQSPKWHQEQCPVCRKKAQSNLGNPKP